MNMLEAYRIVTEAAEAHLIGSGCGPCHIIPTGETRKKLEVAIEMMKARIQKKQEIQRDRYYLKHPNACWINYELL